MYRVLLLFVEINIERNKTSGFDALVRLHLYVDVRKMEASMDEADGFSARSLEGTPTCRKWQECKRCGLQQTTIAQVLAGPLVAAEDGGQNA